MTPRSQQRTPSVNNLLQVTASIIAVISAVAALEVRIESKIKASELLDAERYVPRTEFNSRLVEVANKLTGCTHQLDMFLQRIEALNDRLANEELGNRSSGSRHTH